MSAWRRELSLGLGGMALGGLVLGGCSPAPATQQTVVDTSSSGDPVATALPPAPKPVAKPSHDERVVRHSIALGSSRHCLVDGGRLYCWGGSDSSGALAEPIRAHAEVIPIPGDVTSAAVSRSHSCATTAQGEVWCWGNNKMGELGAGLPDERSDEPRRVLGIDDALSVAIGWLHSCAIRRGGKVSCWGANDSGQGGTPLRTPVRRAVWCGRSRSRASAGRSIWPWGASTAAPPPAPN